MIVKRNFYNRNTVQVAQDLLGCFLVWKCKGRIIRARIIETEAYRGEYDLACHASKGRTPRTEVMYGRSGHVYVYMIYGMYFMLNIVTEEKNFPAAVLIRGIEVAKHPMLKTPTSDVISGPGKLTKFLHVDKSLNGHDMTRAEKLWIECPENKKRLKIIKSPRRGIDYARHCREWKWNFRIVN